MRFSGRSRPYTCLPCQIRQSRLHLATHHSRLYYSNRPPAFRRLTNLGNDDVTLLDSRARADQPSVGTGTTFTNTFFSDTEPTQVSKQDVQIRKIKGKPLFNPSLEAKLKAREHGQSPAHSLRSESSQSSIRHFATTTNSSVELSESQQEHLRTAYDLRQRLHQGLKRVPEFQKDPSLINGIPIDDVLKTFPQDELSPDQQKLVRRIGTVFSGQSFGEARKDLDLIASHRRSAQRKISDPKTKAALTRLGVIEEDTASSNAAVRKEEIKEIPQPESGATRRYQPLASMVAAQQTLPKRSPPKSAQTELKSSNSLSKSSKIANKQSVAASDLILSTVDVRQQAELPQLSFDLSRVLFNPGVYQLRDPRSRVYNFDPYLEQIMPVSEFNFDALNPYLTSSEDKQLLGLARKEGTRYSGSSSSMTAVMSQFHFLISQWRELNVDNFTRGFQDTLRTFTNLNKSPAAIFLRYKKGIYAVDADKEYDEPNVLMSLGKSMEKLLTLEKDEFERWRKSNASSAGNLGSDQPDVFHYSHQGRFLLRSQLDVWDPRLPGTGYFDLKTRAVAGIRMNMREHEAGMGYQIKERFGTWESYEREYYDMMRSVFLKYSLQARMGQMDGIFVAYHNITRMFGFQYIPISEMDMVLHGQSDPSIGDQEFRFSINFMEEIFDAGTQAYPNQSLRIHFEVREASVTESQPYMNIFIEPVSEETVKSIQEAQKVQFDAFEQKLLRGDDPEAVVEEQSEDDIEEKESTDEAATQNNETQSPLSINTMMSGATGSRSSAANTDFLNNILGTPRPRRAPNVHAGDIMCLRLTIQNKINDRPVTRPESISSAARWTIDYQLEQVSDETARKLYTRCKNKRMAALKTVTNRGSDSYFIRSIKQLSEQGAEWRKEQDELDARRERVILYGDRSGTKDSASEK